MLRIFGHTYLKGFITMVDHIFYVFIIHTVVILPRGLYKMKP